MLRIDVYPTIAHSYLQFFHDLAKTGVDLSVFTRYVADGDVDVASINVGPNTTLDLDAVESNTPLFRVLAQGLNSNAQQSRGLAGKVLFTHRDGTSAKGVPVREMKPGQQVSYSTYDLMRVRITAQE